MGYIDFPAHAQTFSVFGQGGRLLARGKQGLRGLSSGLGDRYWARLPDAMRNELTKQHTRYLELHKAHADAWAADLKNLTRDLRNANAKIAKAEKAKQAAEGNQSTARKQVKRESQREPKDEKATNNANKALKSATKKYNAADADLNKGMANQDAAVAGMKRWWESHFPHPLARIEEMFEFKLADNDYAATLEKVRTTVDKLLVEVRDTGGAFRTQEDDAKEAAKNTLKAAVNGAIAEAGKLWKPFGTNTALAKAYQ